MAAAELRTVAGRPGPVELIRRHAAARSCEVAVFDDAGAPVAADGALALAEPVVTPTGLRIDGARSAGAAPVQVFDRVVGWVVAAPNVRASGNGVVDEVARRSADLLSDLCTREFELNDLSREILGAYEELNLFYELSGELAAAADAGAIARVVVRKAARILGSASAWVLLAESPTGVLRAAAAVGAPDGPSDVPPGRGLAGRCAHTNVAEPVDDAATLPASSLEGWERTARGPLLTVPVGVGMREDRSPAGVLQVARAPGAPPFTSGEVKLACALASHAGALLENQRLIAYEREMTLARTIQQSLLPAESPDLAGLEVAGRCVAAASVGGDYFDHFAAGDGRVCVVVADVSGHDLAAALLQTAARATIRSYASSGGADGPAAILLRTNRSLHRDLSRADMFLTAWVATVDGRTGAVRHSDAGHLPALVFRAAAGTVDEITAGGPPIGVLEDASFAEGETGLAPGDVLVAYTDGLTEARSPLDGSEYGTDRLALALREAAGSGARAIADALLADVARWDGGAAAPDDRSVVVVKMRLRDSR